MTIELCLEVVAAAVLVLIIRDEYRELRAWWQMEKKWERIR